MKSAYLFMILCFALFSCKNSAKTDAAKSDSLNFPFKPRYSIHWQPGDEKNALLVLNCLKKYVAGDIKGSVAYFADTAEFVADKFYFRGSRDSLAKIIGVIRGASITLSKEFDSWMTLYYPDKKATWVTLWYTEKMTNHDGRTDSIYYTDDVMVKDGKIVLYDEKQRAFPDAAAKK